MLVRWQPIVVRVMFALVLASSAGGAIRSSDLSVQESESSKEHPGRPVKVAAIAIGSGGERDAKVQLAIDHLHAAGERRVDIACLPETFAGTAPEPIPGPTTEAIAALARQHRMYIVCPIVEQGDDGRQYNTAVLIDRTGEIAGMYRKVFVFWGENLHASREGVKVFDLDFGRVALLTCFDANFDEVWQSAERQNAELVLWPSAYGGGLPLNGYAMIHNYPIVAVGRGTLIDFLGRQVEGVERVLEHQFVATIDLDQTIVHQDFNGEKVARLLKDNAGAVEQVDGIGDLEGWYVLRAVRPGVSVRQLCRKYELETLREYRQRSRREINERRERAERI